MGSEKEVCNSDTLERSNLSSLLSDNNSLRKTSELNSTNCIFHQQTCGNTKCCQIPCPILNCDPSGYSFPCLCEYQLNQNDPVKQNCNEKTKHKRQHFNLKWPQQHVEINKNKICEGKCKVRSNPEKVSDEIHSQYCSGKKNVETNNKNKYIEETELEKDSAEKIEIYYFDHGNSGYYHTTDSPPILNTEKFAEKTNTKLTKLFAEIFGCLHCITSVFTTFFLQCLRFILFSLVRPLTVGVIQLVADYFVKPLLSVTFNGLIQPFLILLYNVATSFRDCCEPLATTLGFYIREVAVLVGSFRLIEITNNNYRNDSNT